ncbi:hypothetical protein BMF81_00523 [Nodularia spumigena UHCC 0039]|jgi:hypothetical protein|uniref:Uncharacterized protein n=2 Tax=Nodularia spumigena TaxID=70799 RepID=A0A2S0Q600_NODSP|nr:hypothetical protein BMF81_00523 [Nodularia spumigena UHCC 0039]MEA5606547.1 hypothetical protein [Nodularia spumigena UHCC 0060]
MSLDGNIKIRERTVMSIFTDFFSKTGESLKFVRFAVFPDITTSFPLQVRKKAIYGMEFLAIFNWCC